jgi:hypothetical protein
MVHRIERLAEYAVRGSEKARMFREPITLSKHIGLKVDSNFPTGGAIPQGDPALLTPRKFDPNSPQKDPDSPPCYTFTTSTRRAPWQRIRSQ